MKHSMNLLYYAAIFSCSFVVIVSTHKNCLPPDVPAHGYYAPRRVEFRPYSVVSFSCSDGFTLEGNAVIECTNRSGAWSNKIPFCDREKNFKVLRGSFISSDLSIASLFDGSMSCNQWTMCNECYMQLQLDKAVAVRAIRILLDSGDTKIRVLTGMDNNMTVCANYEMFNGTKEWILLKCRNDGVLADKIEIRNTGDIFSNISVCRIEVLDKDEYGCGNPPDIRVAHGYFQVNRSNATLICEDDYESVNGRLVCEENSWKSSDPKCNEIKSETSIFIRAVSASIAITILLFLGIAVYLKRKPKE